MTVLADAASSATPYLIGLVGSSGILGAVIALFKLRGDRDSQAVSQAQGAMETMETVLEALERANERATVRGDFYKARCDELEAQLAALHREWGPFPVDEST